MWDVGNNIVNWERNSDEILNFPETVPKEA